MERISPEKLYKTGRKNYERSEKTGTHFLEAGYFHVEDCEGDHHYYYRYLINGEVWEMLEQDVHSLHSVRM